MRTSLRRRRRTYPYALGENVRRKRCPGRLYSIILFWRWCERELDVGSGRSGQGPSRQSGGAANYRHDPLVLWYYSVSPPKWHPKGRENNVNIYNIWPLAYTLCTLTRFAPSLWLDFKIILRWSDNVVLYSTG